MFCFLLFLFSLGYRQRPAINMFVNNDFFLVCVGQGHNGSSLLGLTHMPTLPNPFSSLPSWEHKAAAYCISVSAKYIHLHCREDTPAGHPKGSSPNELFFNTKLITFPPLLPSLLLHLFSQWRRSPSYQPRSQAGGVIFPTLHVCEKTSCLASKSAPSAFLLWALGSRTRLLLIGLFKKFIKEKKKHQQSHHSVVPTELFWCILQDFFLCIILLNYLSSNHVHTFLVCFSFDYSLIIF